MFRNVRAGIALLCVVCFAVQCVLGDEVNALAALFALFTSCVTIYYALRVELIRLRPMSFLFLTGLSVATSTTALVAQSFTLRAISYNLEVPVQTFLFSALLQLLAILVDLVYAHSRLMSQATISLRRFYLRALPVARTPDALTLWTLGLAGLSCLVFVQTDFMAEGQVTGGVLTKFAQASQPLAVLPLYLLFPSVFGGSTSKVTRFWLALYMAAIIAVSVVRNTRGGFAELMLGAGLAFVVGILPYRSQLSKRAASATIVVALFAIPTMGFLSDLSTAMLIARGSRQAVSGIELTQLTVANLANRQLLNDAEDAMAIISGDYTEHYIDNSLVGRLAKTKFIDLSLAEGADLTETYREQARAEFTARLLGSLPAPVLRLVAPDLDKNERAYSSGDFYRWASGRGERGSFVTGTSLGDGLALLGWGYWFLQPALYMLILVMFSALVVPQTGQERATRGRFTIPALLVMPTVFLRGLLTESFAEQFGLITRYYIQTVFVTLIFIILVDVFIRPFFKTANTSVGARHTTRQELAAK